MCNMVYQGRNPFRKSSKTFEGNWEILEPFRRKHWYTNIRFFSRTRNKTRLFFHSTPGSCCACIKEAISNCIVSCDEISRAITNHNMMSKAIQQLFFANLTQKVIIKNCNTEPSFHTNLPFQIGELIWTKRGIPKLINLAFSNAYRSVIRDCKDCCLIVDFLINFILNTGFF